MAGIDANRGAKRAREARAHLGLARDEPLRCLLSSVEQRARLPVVVAALPSDVAGACFRSDSAVLWVNGAQAAVRRRFTLAHELGHVWCEHDGALEVDTFETLSGGTSSPYEIQANAFAAEFLLPHAAMEQCVEGLPTLDEVVVISAYFGVSAQVVAFRLRTLGMATDARVDQLLAEIDERHHLEAFARLGLRALDDRLGEMQHLPYLSPALEGTALGAAVRGEGPVDPAVARAVRRLLR